jgi:L-rhamnose isomerase
MSQQVEQLTSPGRDRIQHNFALASELYGSYGVDVNAALQRLRSLSISLHCWQGDDVTGFEGANTPLGNGLAVTGNHPGRARNVEELREDLLKALSFVPGQHRINLHASYGEFGQVRVERDQIAPQHFQGWIDWARHHALSIDFNATCFSHPKAADGFTLSHPDHAIRSFWVTHCQRAREIGAHIGVSQGNPCVTNLWIPDGFKDTPADRKSYRERLLLSLDEVFSKEFPADQLLDSVEPKLFGIGSESCTIGSHEFYLGYAISRKKLICLDMGHFHPTENVADKISSILLYVPRVLIHFSRGVRWDSDHVVTLTDELQSVAREIVASDYLGRVHVGLDYFDASINRIAAWVMGTRNVLRAFLLALLEPPGIRQAELEGDFTRRLALQEEAKSLPWGAIWNFYCSSEGVEPVQGWVAEVKNYETKVLLPRN